jgi:hypothetical protein
MQPGIHGPFYHSQNPLSDAVFTLTRIGRGTAGFLSVKKLQCLPNRFHIITACQPPGSHDGFARHSKEN